MNSDYVDIISQMSPASFVQFLKTDYKDLVGGETMGDQYNLPIPQLKQLAIKRVQLAQQPEETKSRVVGAYATSGMKLSSQQQNRSANVDSYSKFADDSYGVAAGDYDDVSYDLLDDSAYAPSGRNQKPSVQPQGVSQAPLDLVGVKNAIAQDPNWQPRNDYESWAVKFLNGEDVGFNPTVLPANTNGNTVSPTPKAQDEKYQFNVLENRENRTANIRDIPIPKPVGIKTDLQTGLVYDYNQGLVFNPATGVTQKMLSKGLAPSERTIPDVIQGEQSNFIPVPPIESRLDLDPNKDLSPQARQYLLDRQWGKDKEQAYIQQQDAVNNQLTTGEGRFFGDANYSKKRDNSVHYTRAMGISPRVAQVNQEYSPEVMSRVGQGGLLNNAGSIILPNTWIDEETDERVFSKGKGTTTTIVYKGDKEGNAIPSISTPRVEGSGNELVSFEDAVKRQLISPEQYDNYINQSSQTRFIPASKMDSFNKDNVKLYEATDNSGKNYRATYINPQSKEVYNVTQNGGFYLVRPGVSEEGSGRPKRKKTINLGEEISNINQGMRDNNGNNLVDVIRENPDNPGLEAFTRPVPAINPITGETINKYVHTGNITSVHPKTGLPIAVRWTDEDNPQELFNYFNANQESQGASMEALDLARGGRSVTGLNKAVDSMVDHSYFAKQFSNNPETAHIETYGKNRVTDAYPSLQETDYLGGRLAFNADGNIVDVPSQELATKGINNFTPASEFYSQSPQIVRDTRTGKVIYDPNRTVYVRTGNTGFDDGDFAVVPYKEDKPIVSRVANINSPQSIVINDGKVVGKNAVVQQEVFSNQEVYPGDFTNTQFYRFPTNPGTPLAAYKVNEFGTPIPDEYGFPVELPIQLPRSAQIANKAEVISQPRLTVQDFKGATPDYQPIPDGMSYEEADRKGLLNPIFNARTVGLNRSYQIPLPKGVGLARVLDESDPRTQTAITAQAEAEARIAGDNTIIKPAFDRKYSIAPSRTAGIDSPQYAQYTDLKTFPDDDTRRFWREDLDGIVPQGVIDGAYLPVTVTPRPVNTEGKKGWLINNQVYTTESGREVRGDKALNYVNVPLNLDGVRSYLPTGKREELVEKGFDDAAIDSWVAANPNLARDNALANAKIMIDGQYYDVTPQATVAEFNPAAGGNYAMAETRSQGRAARIDLPFKAGENISEPTPEWIQQQAVSGNLNFNPDDYISPDDKAILNQKEIYNAGYEEATDILGAINRTQQKKNQIDAVISNTEQRLKEQYGLAGNQAMLSNDFGTGLLDKSVGAVVNGEYVTTSSMPDLTELKSKSNQLADEISRASAAHNAIVNVEDSPEVVVSRKGTFNQLLDFNERGQEELGLNKYAGDISQQVVGYDKFDRPLYKNSLYGTLPDLLLPYEQAKELNQTGLLPAYRTQQKVKLPTVPTSNAVNLGRVTPFPEEVITTAQFVPAGNQVVDIVPSSSEKYQYRSGGNANYGMWDMPITNDLGGMGFDGGSIPGDYVPRQVRTNVQQRVQAEPQQVRASRTQSPNIPIEPDVRMTGGMNIPKWAIPATLGAVWLGLAANARRQQDEEKRQQQGVVNRY